MGLYDGYGFLGIGALPGFLARVQRGFVDGSTRARPGLWGFGRLPVWGVLGFYVLSRPIAVGFLVF